MSNTAYNWARSLPLSSASEKAILKELADRANAQNECHPGVDQLSFDTAFSTRTVTAALSALEEKGLISRRPRYKGYQQRIIGDMYKVHVGATIEPEKRENAPRGKRRDTTTTEAAAAAATVATADDAVEAASAGASVATNEGVASTTSSAATVAVDERSAPASIAPAPASIAAALTVEPSVNPQSSSVLEVPTDGEPNSIESDEDPAESLYLGLSMIDDDDFDADAVTDKILRGLDPKLSRDALVSRLRQGGLVDVDEVNLTVAALTIWERRKGAIGDPIAYVASSIEKDPTNEAWVRHYAGEGPPRPSGGALTADRVCAVHGHPWVGAYDEVCGRCGAERPGWRDARDAAQQHEIIPQGATR